MKKIQVNEIQYLDKVYACWLGKNIGGTLGAPYETKKSMNNLTFYDPIPNKAAPNDDLDLQLIWLKMIEEKGIYLSLVDFAEYWKRYAFAYPWNEYGFLKRNLNRGLMPPITGCFENYFIDEMGSPIRSEIWACIAAGDPQLAASMALMDAFIDHAGGEGMYGEMFWAAVESAAFIIKDPKLLVQIGLNMIPLHSVISRAIREALWCYENGISWIDARERILLYFGHKSPLNAPQNHGFTIIGWLYGNDFGDKLCKTVNCGYDTDCTGATLGALLGIIYGTEGIPQKWRDPIGEEIVLHLLTKKGGLKDAPKNINELTERIFNIAKKVLIEKSDSVTFGKKTINPKDLLSLLFRNEKALEVLKLDPQSSISMADDIEVTLHYRGDPVIRQDIEKTLGVSLKLNDKKIKTDIKLMGPEDWKIQISNESLGQICFLILASKVEDYNTLTINFSRNDQHYSTSFTILGPNEAQGYPSGAQIPKSYFKGSDKEWLQRIGLSKKNNS
ncbi:MAG: ADP-ribosylglycohydrolase family protein [Candidatus Thorarchaeota archaeon]